MRATNTDMKDLINYIERSTPISSYIKNDLKKIAHVKYRDKGNIVLRENSNRKIQIFVAKGCLRSFYKTENGKEHTLQFAIKNWWISDYITLFKNTQSIMSIECLVESKIIIFEQTELENIYSKYPELGVVQRKSLENRISTQQKRILGLLTLSAKEKYQRFINDYALFEKIIPNYQIASFLGITPESLSRIRKKISKT